MLPLGLAVVIRVLQGQRVFTAPAAGHVATIAQWIMDVFLYFASQQEVSTLLLMSLRISCFTFPAIARIRSLRAQGGEEFSPRFGLCDGL